VFDGRLYSSRRPSSGLIVFLTRGELLIKTIGAGEDRGPLMPKIDPLFGFLIRVLPVWVPIALLALNRHNYYRNA
jgi:hypothetical protein